MQLTDILPVEKWIELEKNINNRYGLNAAVLDKDGNKITEYQRWANSLCPVVKGNEKGRSFICAVANQNMIAQAVQTRKPVNGECDAGLVKLVLPIFVGDEFVGIAGGCGRLLDDSEVDSFLVNKLTGIDQEEVESFLGDIGKITADEVESVIAYVEEQIKRIVNDFEKQTE